MSTQRKHPFARFTRALLGLIAGYLVLATALTTTVDPWRIHQLPWQSQAVDPWREISDVVRIGKAALARQGQWEVAILGSSRMEIGFDPAHPAFAGKRAVNLAMSAASLLENIPAARHALAHNPELKTLVLGIDPGDLTNDIDIRRETGFYDSPLAGEQSWEQRWNQLIGSRALVDSFQTIARLARRSKPDRNALGLWEKPNNPEDLRASIEASFWPTAKLIPDQWAQRPQKVFEPKARILAEFLRDARAQGISLWIVVPPQHAIKEIHPFSDTPQTIAWEKDLKALVALCDEANQAPGVGPPVRLHTFLTFNSATTEALPQPGGNPKRLTSWLDLGHSHPNVGGLILDELFGPTKETKLGVDLLATDWETFRAGWLEDHRAYCAQNARDVAWWRALAAKSKPARTAASDAGETPQ